MAVPVIAEHIEIIPGTCGGKPKIAGHRITVQNIAIWHNDLGLSPQEIARRYSITLGDVYAALAYYYNHEADILAQIRADEEFVNSLRCDQPSILEKPPKVEEPTGSCRTDP